MNRLNDLTKHDLAILSEHLIAPALGKWPHGPWPDVLDLDIAEYVDKAFDGAIVDDLDAPESYLIPPGDAVMWRKQAFETIVHALQARYRRPLNGRDQALVSMAIVSTWERNADAANERAGMRAMLRDLNADNAPQDIDRAALREAGR